MVLRFLAAGLLVGLAFYCSGQDPKAVTSSNDKHETLEGLHKTIERLRVENQQLRERLSVLEKRVGAQSIQDHLVQEEQRIENVQAQLVAIGEKESPLQLRLAEIDEQLRPGNIDQMLIAGSLRPEEVREATRQRLTSEQKRIRSQLELLHQSRTHLQSSLSVTEMLVQNLRLRLQKDLQP